MYDRTPFAAAPAGLAALALFCFVAVGPAAAQDTFSGEGEGFGVPLETAPAPGPVGADPGSAIGIGPFANDLASAPNFAARISGGVGLGFAPDYFGSDETSIGPTGILRFDYVRLPGGLEFGSVGAPGLVRGFGPRGSVRYIPSRRASSNSELRGLEDVDRTLEVGFGIGYDAEFARAFADARYGFGGYEGFAGEFGADALLYPRDDVIVNIGPRAQWGDGSFMDTYFSVSEEESANSVSGFQPYNASGGFYSVGVELGARYQFSPAWGVEGRVNYDYLINDAADSPITDLGSRSQFGGRVLITRSISLGF